MAVEGWNGKESPLQLPDSGIATYALDWQLREIGGKVEKSPPKDGSYRTLDNELLIAHAKALKPEQEQGDVSRLAPEVLTRARRQQANRAGRSRG